MITTADALDVMTEVAACHHRTAPRMDDEEAALVTATIWARLFNHHHLEQPDLLAAVEKRAAEGHVDAPEPAEIITYARAIRRERNDRTGPTPEYQALCESKGADTQELAANRTRLAQLAAGIGKTIDDA
ncbi:Uncharacterised protein [Mycolicibacterium vanbaalenii]|uniref:Uncharacterized protein n=1 Tax=Mycolicibacterium vanbaalenii TaxID=110539 RepID=A0A5S9R6F5_MYCVN|nr:hypothetical protein [Mycolicibacterium vanbaalenii]CAA0129307.1 Uncharacterised protein [Mycolicibacterium vanbaalenii]